MKKEILGGDASHSNGGNEFFFLFSRKSDAQWEVVLNTIRGGKIGLTLPVG